MELSQEMIEKLKADLKTARTYQDLTGENGAIKRTYLVYGWVKLREPIFGLQF